MPAADGVAATGIQGAGRAGLCTERLVNVYARLALGAAFLSAVASRFGVAVTQKAAAQAVPVIGALSGGAVNYAFIEHFQDVARGHFIVRRLERAYGKEPVRREYERLARTP